MAMLSHPTQKARLGMADLDIKKQNMKKFPQFKKQRKCTQFAPIPPSTTCQAVLLAMFKLNLFKERLYFFMLLML